MRHSTFGAPPQTMTPKIKIAFDQVLMNNPLPATARLLLNSSDNTGETSATAPETEEAP